MTVTTTGSVLGGTAGATNLSTIGTGYNLIVLQVPISTNLVGTTFGLPTSLTSSNNANTFQNTPTAASNDQLLVWNFALQGYTTFYFFNSADATYWEQGGPGGPTFPDGFYDQAGNPMPTSAYPQVNQGFFLHHIGAPVTWTNSFSVN